MFKKTTFFLLTFYTVVAYSFQQENLKKDSLSIAKKWHLKANTFYETANYLEAVYNYNYALKLTPNNTAGRNLYGTILYDRAFAEYNLEQYIKSYKTVKKAEVVLSALKKPDLNYLLSIYADLGSEASYLGFYKEAEYYLTKGTKLYLSNKKLLQDKYKTGASKAVLFEYKFVYLYSQSGNEQKMLKHLTRFKELKKQQIFNETEKLMYATSFNDVGDFYLNNRKKNNKKEALIKGSKYITKAIQLLDKKQHPSSFIQFKFNVAKQLRYSKKYKKALQVNQEIIDLAGKKDVRVPFFTAQRGLLFLEMKDKRNALKEFYNMASLIHQGNGELLKNYSNFKPSSIVNHTGLLVEIADELLINYPKDTIVLEQASTFYKIGLKQLKNSYQENQYSNRIKEYYKKAIGGILKTKQLGYGKLTNKQVINDIENIENKLAWKEFNQNRKFTSIVFPDSLQNKETYLRSKIVSARKKNDSLKVLELQNQLEKHYTFLAEEHPILSEFVYSNFDISNFQKSLNKTTIVLIYKLINEKLYIFKISTSNIKIFTIDYYTIKKSIKKYISILKKRSENKALAKKIFKELIPFDILNNKTITIVPDAILHHLPFETLVNNKGKYLVQDLTISYAPHLIFIKNNKNQDSKNNELYVFSPSYKSLKKESQELTILKGAEKESELVAEIFSNKKFINEKATKESFINNASKAGIVHLAMHASIDNEKPELSYFSFQNNISERENKMYLEELYGLKLNASLAVLSACNTGTGLLENYNGAVSLQRAFTLSGVSATVSSLWEIPDKATQEIIVSFYKNLKKGFSKAKALQIAKNAYINSNNDVNLNVPYYWAGFVISGDMTLIASENAPNNIFLVGAIIILLVIVMFILIQRLQKR